MTDVALSRMAELLKNSISIHKRKFRAGNTTHSYTYLNQLQDSWLFFFQSFIFCDLFCSKYLFISGHRASFYSPFSLFFCVPFASVAVAVVS